MEIKTINKNDSIIQAFIEKANVAYLARSSSYIPFEPLSIEDIRDNEQIFIVIDEEEMVAGCCLIPIRPLEIKLQHVWTDVKKARKGYASFLVNEVEKVAKEQGNQQLKLGVMAAYKPACKLYRKKGWKPYALVANTPPASYTISMVKYLYEKGKLRFEIKRCIRFFFNRIKFFILFRRDSTPKWLYRVVYKK